MVDHAFLTWSFFLGVHDGRWGFPILASLSISCPKRRLAWFSVLGEFSATDEFRDLWVTVSSTSKESCMNKHWVKNRLELR